MKDYLYEVVVNLVFPDGKEFIGQYFTDAAPPAVGTLYNPKFISSTYSEDFVVKSVRIMPDDLDEIPNVGRASAATAVFIDLSPKIDP